MRAKIIYEEIAKYLSMMGWAAAPSAEIWEIVDRIEARLTPAPQEVVIRVVVEQ